MVYKLFDKRSSGGGIKKENMPNQEYQKNAQTNYQKI